MIERVVVYLGASGGNRPEYAENAARLGRLLAQNGIEIIYGGSCVGTMWAMASAALEAGGKVTGVYPENFRGRKEMREKGVEVKACGLTRMIGTPDLASRIAKMEELSQACIVMPGSCGTMHEFFCWMLGHQLNGHAKPLFIVNTGGYYSPLKELLGNMAASGFMSAGDASLAVFCDTVEDAVNAVVAVR